LIPSQIGIRDFFLRDLLEKLNPGDPENIRMRHPFARAELRGSAEVSAALERLADPLSSLRGAGEYFQPGLAAKCWDADLDGRKIRGVTTVSVPDSGDGAEAAIMLSTYPSAAVWREKSMADSPHAPPPAAWELPADADITAGSTVPESELDPKLPFPIALDMVFHSPILSRPVRGPELITRIFAYTSAIYGDRRYGPKIQAGRNVMSFWEASVSGLAIEVANEIRFNVKGEVEEMTMSMRPWPVVKLFRERCLATTRHFLDISYFGS
jgi:hypothetical protein